MNFSFGFVLVGLGAALLYKGYRGWDWATFYKNVLGKGK